MNMRETLQPCPFCGGAAEYDNSDTSAHEWIACTECGSTAGVDRWNARAPSPPANPMTHNRELVANGMYEKVRALLEKHGYYIAPETQIFTRFETAACCALAEALSALSPSVDANDHTMSGALVFTGTRLPLSCILSWIRAGSDNATIQREHPDVTPAQIEGCRRLSDSLLPPVPMSLDCPACGVKHIDEGEWATRPHKTHQCQSCGHEWRPYPYATVGVPSPEPEPVAWQHRVKPKFSDDSPWSEWREGQYNGTGKFCDVEERALCLCPTEKG